MQDASFRSFEKEIQDVQEYIKHIGLIDAVGKSTRDSTEQPLVAFNKHLKGFMTSKKLFEYKSIVISLYGILEKYTGIWIREHIEAIPNIIPNYAMLPEKLSEQHFSLSVKLISIIIENRFAKYEHLNKNDILIKLSSCMEKPLGYSLNSESFSLSSGNLKHSKIIEAFKALDIDLQQKLVKSSYLFTVLNEKYGSNFSKRGAGLFKVIDELVVRRNDIAHGADIDDILDIEGFNDYIVFLEKYGQAIFEVLVEKELEYKAAFTHSELGSIIGIRGFNS